ncbi:ATP-dependent helicase [Bacillus coahuilensis p1.1.43]|uniref:ATP-dependent helicase/deoxyribonuclease subunit B n=1 Tax=Bacillus coahuilensis p1.1.43 TaxID=1150625 RepID=A0A147KAJ9_9BACI|nr:helicase-exonuclease AddAB subunit AddB [Bacillus coahuilensis]KUP07740.1 ATP-dependent helicase [Bacillus coahuilensis p1.1.43]
MSLRLITGRAGSGKTATIIKEIKEKLKENPMGRPIIYLVPEQMTFLSEYALVQDEEIKGIIRAQVYSFTRLAWRVLQDTGGMNRYHLSSVGLNMLIRKIITDHKDEFTLFKKASDKPGFVKQVEDMLIEFKRYLVEPETIMGETESRVLSDKLHDLEIIFREFELATKEKYIDSEDYLTLLSSSIERSSYLKDADIYIDGFHSFTPQEYAVIQALMERTKRVTIAFTIDRSTQLPYGETKQLFRMTEESISKIESIAYNSQIQQDPMVVLDTQARFKSQTIAHLERHWETRPSVPSNESSYVTIVEAANPRAEIEGIAREIRRLARGEGYRYRDIALFLRNSADYGDIIETIFYDYDIPFFMDQKRTMLNHPLIELVRSTLETIHSHWRYEAVFRAVKTDLLFPLDQSPKKLREKMDRLENYVLAYGIKGSSWTNKDRWRYRRFRGLELTDSPQTDEEREKEHEINELRLFISAPILRLGRRMKRGNTVRDYCISLYQFLEELDIPQKLERFAQSANDRGDVIAAREHDQAWNAVVDLLDQYVEILGDSKLSVKRFSDILDAGIETMKFSLVPPSNDQVIVADLELSRLANIRAGFVIGVNDGVLPSKFQDEGILSAEDRTSIADRGVQLAPTSTVKLEDEEFVAYKAFTTPSERLYISYALANDEGKALMSSPYIKRINELLPNIRTQMVVQEPSELHVEFQKSYASHPTVSISYVTTQLQLGLRGYQVAPVWWDVYNYYMKSSHYQEKVHRILTSLFYQNRTKKLSEETSKELYGESILGSVSRMELFNSCPFSHFASHGLKLREREMYRLEAPDIGELFHGALKWISDMMNDQNRSWKDLSKADCRKLAQHAVEVLAPRLQKQILLSSNRHHYIKRKLELILERASLVLSEQAKVSGFTPVGLELGFGPNGELPPFAFTLKNGIKMELQGRIDRVDKGVKDEQTFLRIIDYKSSQKDLDLTEVYYGISLQMLTYLDIVLTHSEKLVQSKGYPGGVLYFHIHDPLVKSKKLLTVDQIEEEIFKSFRMKGLLLGDQNLLQLMDETLEPGGKSRIVSAELKKDGSLSSRSKVASEQDFNVMRNYIRKQYEHVGNKIVTGVVDIEPYKLKKKVPCQFCSYRSVCQFDQSLEESDYRVFTPYKQDEALDLMREEGKGKDE